MPRSPEAIPSLRVFTSEILYVIVTSHCYAICFICLILLDKVILIIHGEYGWL
jgi:hypothetical protein